MQALKGMAALKPAEKKNGKDSTAGRSLQDNTAKAGALAERGFVPIASLKAILSVK